MKVIVTGASGFIGAACCRALVARGDEVFAVSRRGLAAVGAAGRRCNLGDREQVQALVTELEPEAVLHLAGAVTGSRAAAASTEAFATTLGSTVHLLEALSGRSIQRVVIAGSLEEVLPGDTVQVPASPYAAAKTAARSWADLAWAHWGVPMVWARLFMVYGPGQGDHTKLVPAACRALLRGEVFDTSSGRRLVDWIYVDDVVDGLLACLDRPGIEGGHLDLGTGALTSVRAVVERLHQLVPQAPEPAWGALPDRAFEVERAADLATTERRLAWKPRYALGLGLERTLDWVRSTLQP
jgi:nucleoside-diphosphate-sugar epimerase